MPPTPLDRRPDQWRKAVVWALLLALTGPVDRVLAQFAGDRPSHMGAGLRFGPSKGSTELEDQDEFLVHGFLQRSLRHRWQGELGLGYGQLTNTRYSTDMLLAHLRLMRTLVAFENWYGYAHGGIGLIDYDIVPAAGVAEPPFERLGITRSLMTGAGFQISLTNKLTLEVDGGYTHALTDRLNGARGKAGNDGFWSWSLGLRIEERPRGWVEWRSRDVGESKEPVDKSSSQEEPVEEPPPPEVLVSDGAVGPEALDQDGDGLSDFAERRIHFTNPLMFDSDADGLSDGAEVREYGTNPNVADSDGGGVDDGTEVGRGTDPGERRDDGGPSAPASFPAILFEPDSARLDTGDEMLLDQVVNQMLEQTQIRLELRGYTDDVGGVEENLELASRRAHAVYDYLVSRGVAAGRLRPRALGEESPRAANDTPAGRRQNRRVELMEQQ